MDLEDYKNKIANLSINEEKMRDLYLREIALGNILGPMTGYASIDKPWLKFYNEKNIKFELPRKTVYRNILDKNINNLNDIYIEYFGKKITYGTFFRQVDEFAKAFYASGVKKGDIVALATATTPEDLMMYFALNKIGAVCHSIDLRFKRNAFKEILNKTKAKKMVIADICYDEVEKIIDDTSVNEVYINAINDSMSPIMSLLYNMKFGKKKINNPKFISCKELLKRAKTVDKEIEVDYEPNRLSNLINTSGTSGKSKIVMLSDDNINSVIAEYEQTNLPFERQLKYVNLMPNFLIFGRVVGLIMPAYFGIHTILNPDINPSNFPSLIHKYKPQIILGGPIHFNELIQNQKPTKNDKYDIRIIASGGSKMPSDLKLSTIDFFKNHGVKNPIVLEGCGTTEDCSTECTCINQQTFKSNGVGIPLVKNNVMICSPETHEELSYDILGEICYCGPGQMLGYWNDTKKTNNALINHNGKTWFHTGDIAVMSKDGLICMKDRIKRTMTCQGFGVYPTEIEEVIREHYAVNDCIVASMPISDNEVRPKAYIVLKDKYKECQQQIFKELENLCFQTLPDYSLPCEYEMVESIPYSAAGKPDYRILEEKNKEIYNSKKLIKTNN